MSACGDVDAPRSECPSCPSWVQRCAHFDGRVLVAHDDRYVCLLYEGGLNESGHGSTLNEEGALPLFNPFTIDKGFDAAVALL